MFSVFLLNKILKDNEWDGFQSHHKLKLKKSKFCSFFCSCWAHQYLSWKMIFLGGTVASGNEFLAGDRLGRTACAGKPEKALAFEIPAVKR
jgi:hypothetical protein